MDMDSNTQGGGGPPQPPKKRSLFKAAPVERKVEAEDALALFSRASEVQAQRLRDEEMRRKNKKKGIIKQEKKRIEERVEKRERTPDGKRRRTSSLVDSKEDSDKELGGRIVVDDYEDEEEEEELVVSKYSGQSSAESAHKRKRLLVSNKRAPSSPTSLSSRYQKSLQPSSPENTLRPTRSTTRSTAIILGDSDDSDPELPISINKKPASAVQPVITIGDDDDYVAPRKTGRKQDDEEQLSEEEFPELVQQAKERRLRMELEKMKAAKSAASKASNGNPTRDNDDIFQLEPKNAEVDPPVDIFIDSYMEGSKPLIVQRKLSQKLEAARYAWCDKQNLAEMSAVELKKEVFLTWKHKRVYDSTTCRALKDDKLSADDAARGRIYLEAWTQQTFDLFMKQEKSKLRKEQGESEDEDATPEPVEEVKKIKIFMKAKDMEPFKLVVKPSTQLERIAAAYRKSREVDEERGIKLFFDGDELDLDATIADTELDDMDSIEVHIS